MKINNLSHPNFIWAELIIEELRRNKVETVCIAPGYRSAPLAVAAACSRHIKKIVHYDERGLAFFALGLASSKIPSAVICTSGTAVANLFPAVIEASKKKLPLIVITADRPPELRKTGAHQTIDQAGIFHRYVRWEIDMPCPQADIPPEYVLTTIDQAVFASKEPLAGPVHINIMFREPLAPVGDRTKKYAHYPDSIKPWLAADTPFTQYYSSAPVTGLSAETNRHRDDMASVLNRIKNGIIVCGKLSTDDDRAAIIRLSEKLGWPVFPDLASGLRTGSAHKNIIHYFDQLLLSNSFPGKQTIDGVVHFGGRMTSKRYYALVERMRPGYYVTVLDHALRNDPLHVVSHRVPARPKAFVDAVIGKVARRKENALLRVLRTYSRRIDARIDEFMRDHGELNEISVARIVSRHIPENSGLFLSNSMVIRDMDMYAAIGGRKLALGANRGASGIDGIIATGMGFARGIAGMTTLLLGDTAFLHDVNSLPLVRYLPRPVIIVVNNNRGGGIFSFMPIKKRGDVCREYFQAEHDLEFENVAAMFDIPYKRARRCDEFEHYYRDAMRSNRSIIIENIIDLERNLELHGKLQESIKALKREL